MKSDAPVEKQPKEGLSKYDIEHMASVLIEAEEIKADPKKMAAVKGHLGKKKQAINSIQDLRDKRKQLQEEKAESPSEEASEPGEEA